MQPVGASVAAFVDAGAVDDDVGIVGAQHGRVIAPGGHGQHHVVACQRAEIVHQRGQVVLRLEQHEPASVAEFGGGRGDPVGEVAVGKRRGFGQHRDPVAVAAQMLDEPAHLQDDSVADHLDAHLGVDRRRIEAVLSHDDRCGVAARGRS